jgi:hypothetical protein
MNCLIGSFRAYIPRPLARHKLAYLSIVLSINPPRIYAQSKWKKSYSNLHFLMVAMRPDLNKLIFFPIYFRSLQYFRDVYSWTNFNIPFYWVAILFLLESYTDECLEVSLRA